MFSNIFQKAALLGASTVASVALTGMMASSAQAATMSSYTSNFSLTSNNLDAEVVAGEFSYTKTELDSGLFSYKLEDFNAQVMNRSFTISDIPKISPFLTSLNDAFTPDNYQSILPSVLENDVTNVDLPALNLTRIFSGNEFTEFASEYNLTSLLSAFVPPDQTQRAEALLGIAFSGGGEISLTTTSTSVPQSGSNLASVPEPTSILGIGIIGVGLTATRRKRATKKIKQKVVA
jgi:hypothetical protein